MKSIFYTDDTPDITTYLDVSERQTTPLPAQFPGES